jgi:adenylate kinase
MIFVGGIHGVGKSYFCEKAKTELGVQFYSASKLISNRKRSGFPKSKFIPDIDENQQFLIDAVNELNATSPRYLLDGHFCLLDGDGAITRIAAQTFSAIQPDAIVVLTESPEVIAERRQTRDEIVHSTSELEQFQSNEINYAKEIAALLSIPIYVSTGASDTGNAIDFIKTNLGGNQNGR